MTDTPANALGEPSPNRTDFVKWARLNLEQFARHAADENLLLRTENAKLKEDLATALDAWRKCELQRADALTGRFTIDNPCACGAYGGPESHAKWCGYALGVAPTALALPRRGLVVLKNVIQLLREEARFVDEEGDDTNALEELLEALLAHGVKEGS